MIANTAPAPDTMVSGHSHLEVVTVAHFQPEIYDNQEWIHVETVDEDFYFDTHVFHESDVNAEFQGRQDQVVGIRRVQGFGARLNAPGYLDCTPWAVFDTRAEAEEYLADVHDAYLVPTIEVECYQRNLQSPVFQAYYNGEIIGQIRYYQHSRHFRVFPWGDGFAEFDTPATPIGTGQAVYGSFFFALSILIEQEVIA